MRLALYNFAMLKMPGEDPANRPFHDRNELNFAAAEASDGFIARSGYAEEPGPANWGEQVYPRHYVDNGDGWSPSTLSLWRDLESAMAFSYRGIHVEAMRAASNCFVPSDWPMYVAWWVADDHTPNWEEAVARLEHLHDLGVTAFAFDFRKPFDAGGDATLIDKTRMKQSAQINTQRDHEYAQR